jgi:hypothetical protein
VVVFPLFDDWLTLGNFIQNATAAHDFALNGNDVAMGAAGSVKYKNAWNGKKCDGNDSPLENGPRPDRISRTFSLGKNFGCSLLRDFFPLIILI